MARKNSAAAVRGEVGDTFTYEFGSFRLDATERHLRYKGQPVPMTSKLFDLLLLLVQNSGHLLKKDELISGVWSEQFVEEYNLTVAVSTLRKILGTRAKGQRFIETVSGHGYRFAAPVRRVFHAPARTPESEIKTYGDSPQSIAVLPFVNQSHAPSLEYLSDGIAESIINNLSRLPRLKVMARSTTFRHRGAEVDARKVGRKLSVGVVLTGRVSKFGRNIVIGAELMDTTDGSQVWGEKYQRPFSNILVVQEEIAREVVQKLRLKLSREEEQLLAKRHTNSPESYRLYLQGRFLFNKRTGEGLKKSVEYFRRAIQVDDRYALAYAGLADSFHILSAYKILPPSEGYPMAREAALTALKIDATLAEAHASLAHISMIYEWDWASAEKGYRRAIELNPNIAALHHWFAVYLRVRGRFEESLAELETALRLEPVSLIINCSLGAHFYFMRRPDLAIEQLSKTLELDANFPTAHLMLGLAYGQKGQYDKAIAEVRKVIRLLGNNSELLSRLGYFYASAKRKTVARSILHKLMELRKRKYVAAYEIAVVQAALGEKEKAFEWLERAFAEHDETLCQLGLDPILDSLRSEPQFTDLLNRVGLPTSPRAVEN